MWYNNHVSSIALCIEFDILIIFIYDHNMY